MESNRKRKGFMKAKLAMSFYRAAKPSSSSVQYSSKVKPSPPPSSTASVGYVASSSSNALVERYVVNPDYVTPQPKPKLSFLVPEINGGRDSYSSCKFDNPYGGAGDESVDVKAATYISSVQERFRLERVNSERYFSPAWVAMGGKERCEGTKKMMFRTKWDILIDDDVGSRMVKLAILISASGRWVSWWWSLMVDNGSGGGGLR
ncbi:hypothetical protein F0562_004493 [Nyssa sinensis]|uniref:Uncharacterized protein n=1 Tax=Nyssa sinensis TaxID=561372 RepID=A0A5J5C032_9ASTE|nr:hypothetical protein F0562_004493 [Nyssa sinensis]